jgi:superfamily II DNA or RNA helicase
MSCSQALDLKGNTLVLFLRVEAHGKVLYDQINNSKQNNRKVFFVYGGIDAEEREKVREITERENDAIIVASYGTFSTGINIKNLHNVIFASPSKSRIRNLQSIGRVLRKGKNKVEEEFFEWLSNIVGVDIKYDSSVTYPKSSDEGNKLKRTLDLEKNIRSAYRKDFEALYQ